MKFYYLLSCLILCSCLFSAASLTAQKPFSNEFFQSFDEKSVQLRQFEPRPHQPESYTAWKMDYARLAQHLLSAPHETASSRKGICTFSLPVAQGTFESFSVWATDIMHPDLQAKFPDIRTYSGISNDGTGNTVRITMSSVRGAHITLVRPDMSIAYIEPYWWGQTTYYMQFERSALTGKRLPDFTSPYLEPVTLPTVSSSAVGVSDRGALTPVELYILRFAITPTKGFVEDHGGTKESCMAALVSYANRTNIAYERDCAMRLQLISNNDKLIGGSGEIEDSGDNGNMAAANRQLTNTRIGFANYDIGHVFARGGGGVSLGLGIVCGPNKSGGCSAGGGRNDYGDFFVGVVGQETGHQLSGAHTWNFCGRGNSQRSGNSAYEPGSGTTIMSYSGLCGADNIGNGGFDLYYHSHSIDQIRGFANTATCGSKVVTANNKPSVKLDYTSGFYIPINTPFVLKGEGSDPDGDELTYCWEEFDKGPETPVDTPIGTAPLFRTFPAVKENFRYFPRYSSVLNNAGRIRAEQLPTYTRDLTFRLTVRDNNPLGGGTVFEEVEFKSFEGAGPFTVSFPNGGLSTVWEMGKYEQVRWDVANTNEPPVNCAYVNILLSRDGGKTFTDTLAARTANDGSQYILVPKVTQGFSIVTARIKIEAADNIFYDLSNANFTIRQPASPSYSLSISEDQANVCLPAVFETEISAAGTLGFSDAAVLSVEGNLPPQVKAEFTEVSLAPGGTVRLRVDMSKLNARTTFNLSVKATLPNGLTIVRPITLNTLPNDFSNLKLTNPVNGSTGLILSQVLRWQKVPDAQTYEVQLATSPAFNPGDIKASVANIKTDSFRVPILLQKNTAYYWRVRPTNVCGTAAWTDPVFFSTLSENCSTLSANDLPLTITQSAAVTVQSKITVNATGKVGTVAVKQIKGNHTFFKELTFSLKSPDGQEAVLVKNACGGNNIAFDFAVTDLAGTTLTGCSPLPLSRAYKPLSPLSVFNGKDINGAWSLVVNDNTQNSGGGKIDAFVLEFCTSISLAPPVSNKNNTLELASGTNKPITNDLLSAQDPNNTPDQLIYTLVTVPKYGHLEKNLGGALKPGSQFSQADIDAGILRYFHDGTQKPDDYFLFTITDNEGGFLGTPRFNIRITDVVSSRDIHDLSQTFGLYPNPAEGFVWVGLDQAATSDYQVSLYNAAGQRLLETVLPAGTDRVQLPLESVTAGIYWVRLENATAAGVRKLVRKD